MFAKRVFIIVGVCVAVFSGSPTNRAQDLAEAARKAKAKKQQQQPDASSSPTTSKPKTYTNDDFPGSGGTGVPSTGQDIPGLTQNPAPGKDTAIVLLTPPNSTLTRPGSMQVFWSVKNTSDHPLDLTINLIVTGPCGFRQEHPVHLQLNNGGGFLEKRAIGVRISQANCSGPYSLELRAESYHHLLSRAWAPLKVV